MTKICCVCQRVEHGSHWQEDYEFGQGERVTHGYCPLCFDIIMAELMDDRATLLQGQTEEKSVSGQKPRSAVCA